MNKYFFILDSLRYLETERGKSVLWSSVPLMASAYLHSGHSSPVGDGSLSAHRLVG